MNDYLKRGNIFSERQCGFMNSKSLLTSLLDAVEDFMSRLGKNIVFILTLLDHNKSVNHTVAYRILISKLYREFYFFESAYNLIFFCLSNDLNWYILMVILGPFSVCLYINDLPGKVVNGQR